MNTDMHMYTHVHAGTYMLLGEKLSLKRLKDTISVSLNLSLCHFIPFLAGKPY